MANIRVKINLPGPREPFWEGWGCSLAWWAQAFGHDIELSDLLFSKSYVQFRGKLFPGLGLNIVRYLAGSTSTSEVGGKQMIRTNDPTKDYRFLETFWKDPGTWDFERDEAQRTALIHAKDRGVNIFELFSNSPPWWMLKNKNPSGAGTKAIPCENLMPEHYDNFAFYLISIVKHAKDQWGVDFNTVEAFNEATKSWWCPEGATQEGCYFSCETQKKIIVALNDKLKESSLWNECKISASDDWGYSDAYQTMTSFDTETISMLGQWNVHGYEGKNGPRHLVERMARQTCKKVWNSEYGDNDATGLDMAWNIIWDFIWLKPTAWCYWQPVDGIGGWGLIKPKEEDFLLKRLSSQTEVRSKFYVLAHFTRHILPGMKVLTSNNKFCLVGFDKSLKKLVIIYLNHGQDNWIQFDLTQFVRIDGPITRWWTKIDSNDAADRYQKYTDTGIENCSFCSFFPHNTLQTFEIEGVLESEDCVKIQPVSPESISWEGWGCSLAWWAKCFGSDEELANLLFTRECSVQFKGRTLPGLAFNIVRYLAGTSSEDLVCGKTMQQTNDPFKSYRFLDTFWRNPDSWCWEGVDSNQRAALLLAKDRGANFFELFANSPPWWMLKSQNPSGGGTSDNPDENLKLECLEKYAFYLCSIVQHAKSNWGISFNSIAPFNEPAGRWVPDGASQEGCCFTPSTQEKVIQELSNLLNVMSLSKDCIISTSDDCKYSEAFQTIKLLSPETISQIGCLNVHGYEPNGPRHLVAGVAEAVHKKVWNSEYGDPDGTGVELASNVILDFRWLHPRAWCYWQPVDAIDGWGLVKPPEEAFHNGILDPESIQITQKFFVLAHFTRHICPGMKILKTNKDNCIAAFDEEKPRVAIICVNWGETHNLQFDLTGIVTGNESVRVWSTKMDNEESSPKYRAEEDIILQNGKFTYFFESNMICSFEVDILNSAEV